MKSKTSVTLSHDLISLMDKVAVQFKNRSDLVEQAVRFFIETKLRESREKRDLRLLNRHAERLNREAQDALSYQSEL